MSMRHDHRRRFLPNLLIVLVGLLAVTPACLTAQQTTKKEIDVGFSPIEVVRPLIADALSPQGRFVMLAGKGSILIIDTPQGIAAVERALAGGNLAQADVAMQFQFRTGMPSRKTTISSTRQLPLPAAYNPPTIFVGPNGINQIIPATPTKFETRDIGVTSETNSRVNPDGSITMDINFEQTEFEGFINYGSSILPAGTVGTVPVANPVGNPQFFSPFINNGDILVPVISTTRISTSIVVRPRVAGGIVAVDLMPRLIVEADDDDAEDVVVDLKQFQTMMQMKNNHVGRVNGFDNASPLFNRYFLNAENPTDGEGETAIVIKASVKPPGTAAAAAARAESAEAPSADKPSIPIDQK